VEYPANLRLPSTGRRVKVLLIANESARRNPGFFVFPVPEFQTSPGQQEYLQDYNYSPDLDNGSEEELGKKKAAKIGGFRSDEIWV
jgi:hypothetical protein